ncbi:dATP/dGTP pyrophosphohydrolase domain-containing protein [Ectothiorhodospira mobilis]|uniref:dATP/dGTP pyrophosphohydrolase domain-containing protein n=1 Tax=Ectothiorhodospira mobilis TaxID=195064 RepID=UPI001903F121|nr:dATP/dGTP pyrophosphohydrolase domain-containing protein [Ectothiorhodospira mobilis]
MSGTAPMQRLQAVEQENARLKAENERLANISPHGHVENTRALLELEETLEATADYAGDRDRMLGMIAERLGVADEPRQGRDERILEALDTLMESNRRMEEAIDFACAPDMWEECPGQAGEVYEYKYLEWYGDVLQESLTPHDLHADDAMVEAAALDMRKKLAAKRREGRGGWESCSLARLNSMLVNHIAKGDPVDVLNLAAMIHARGERTSLQRLAPSEEGKAPGWYVTDDKPWFAYCPDQGLMAFGTEAEAVEQAADFIDSWLDGDTGWDELVGQVFVGRATQISGQVDRVDRPDESELDEEGFDAEGNNWSEEFDFMCNYTLLPVVSDAAKAWAATGGGDASGYDLVAHMRRQIAFSKRAFGPGGRCQGLADHIRKELEEIEAAPYDLEEWIDVVLLAFDGAWRSGHTAEQVAAGLEAKLTKNEGRDWPDWQSADPTKAIEHNRHSEEA